MLKTIAAVSLLALGLQIGAYGTADARPGSRGDDARGAAVSRHAGRPGCVAAAKRRGGKGERVPGVRDVAYGGKSCVRAMRGCTQELRVRQRRGLNPRAACVVVRRGLI